MKLEISDFAEDSSRNLRAIQRQLSRNIFQFKPAKGVPSPKKDAFGRKTGKYRPIVLAPVESRIVQRAILNTLLSVKPLSLYFETPYSFGGIRKKATEKASLNGSIAAVPAAIDAVLHAIKAGCVFVVCVDIQAFFTKISKGHVSKIVGDIVKDDKFMELFNAAIAVELSNMENLKGRKDLFPIYDIGVAQGNSLSPLLGNIILAEFDREMNRGDCRCIRYIDDFIILAPTQKAANARLKRAKQLLTALGMNLSPEKSGSGGVNISNGFDFLGINIVPGLIRPSAKSEQKFMSSIDKIFQEGKKSLKIIENGGSVENLQSFIDTLRLINVTIIGWSKHYWFCNDVLRMKNIDSRISQKISEFIGSYVRVRRDAESDKHMMLLGVAELSKSMRKPFDWPKIDQ